MRAPSFLLGTFTRTTHAVLAILSDCCPPPKGRLSTCYAPVRRCTQDRSPFLARLACVKPAANVRSEPGSNSPKNLSRLIQLRSLSVAVLSLPLFRSGLNRHISTRFVRTSSLSPCYSVFRDQNKKIWRRPTLPHSLPCSTVGPGGLNFRVRDGIGCGPSGNAAGNFKTRYFEPFDEFEKRRSGSCAQPWPSS